MLNSRLKMTATTGNLIIRLTTTVRTDQPVDGITNTYQSEKRKTGVLKENLTN